MVQDHQVQLAAKVLQVLQVQEVMRVALVLLVHPGLVEYLEELGSLERVVRQGLLELMGLRVLLEHLEWLDLRVKLDLLVLLDQRVHLVQWELGEIKDWLGWMDQWGQLDLWDPWERRECLVPRAYLVQREPQVLSDLLDHSDLLVHPDQVDFLDSPDQVDYLAHKDQLDRRGM